MKKITDLRVAIVGGGPGGLTLARLLQLRGATVRVHERDVSRAARVQGATLNLNAGSGLTALERCGLLEGFRKVFRPGAEAMSLANPEGEIVLDDVAGEDLQEDRPEIDRGPLRELFLDSLSPDTVVWNSRFSSLTRGPDGITLQFDDGTVATADLVIGADGANSRLRPHVTPLRAGYSGITAIEGVVYDLASKLPLIYQQLHGGKICVLGDDKTLFVVLKGDGSAAFYSGHRAGERWVTESGIDFTDHAQVCAWYAAAFRGWEAWAGLFHEAALFVPRPLFCVPLDQSWEAQPDLTLLGDAAHVMPPYAGEGVNMAMLDAVELADALFDPDHRDVRSAIASYETRMRERTSASAAETMKFTNIFHSPGALPFFLEFFGSVRNG